MYGKNEVEICPNRKGYKFMSRVTIVDIAEKAGVSIATVSYVINQSRTVSPEYKERVEKVIEELGYTPNENARGLRRNRTKTIGLIVPDNTNPFFAEIAKGVEDAVFEAGYSVILCNTNSMPEREMAYVNLLLSKSVAGVIFATKAPDVHQLDQVIERGIPTSVLYRDHEGLDIDSFTIDNFQAGYLAGAHLTGLGHRQIACFRPIIDNTPSALRMEGLRKNLNERGADLDPDLTPRANYKISGGEQAAQILLETGKPFTAVFCGNDAMAIGAMRVFRDAGYRIPEDISIVGLDDIILASYMEPPLTTIAQPKQEIGYQAVQRLLERIEKKYAGGPRHIKVEIFLVNRRSTAPPAARS